MHLYALYPFLQTFFQYFFNIFKDVAKDADYMLIRDFILFITFLIKQRN